MKKYGSFLILVMMSLLLSGCVKFNANMEIKKDKSMNYSIIYAFDKSMFGEEELLDSDDQDKMKEMGFEISEYSQDNWRGFNLTKEIKNIDEVSSNSDEVIYSLSDLLEESNMENNNIFKVKKGFLKNVYTAKIKFNSSDSGLTNSKDDNDTTEIEGMDELSDSISSLTSNLDLSYNVKLPYSATSNNATNASDDKKTLSWTLSTNKASYIEFEFPIYNLTNIYILAGIVLIIIVGIVLSLIKRRN